MMVVAEVVSEMVVEIDVVGDVKHDSVRPGQQSPVPVQLGPH